MPRKSPISPWLLVILLGAWALLTVRIGSEWFGHQDANGAWVSVAVRNYQLHGFFAQGGLVNTNPDLTGIPQPYTHHPPLLVWLSALPVLLVGYDETLLRFVAAGCTLIGAAALYVFARRLKGERFALWSAAFYLFTPMTAYFGRMPDHEAPALLFVLLFAAVLADWLRRPTRGRWWALVVLTVLTCWTAWGGLIVLAALGAAALVDTQRRVAVVALALVAAASLLAMLGYYLVYFPDAITDLISVFVWRTSTSSLEAGAVSFTWGDYALRLLVRLITLYTPSLLVLALVGAFVTRRQRGLRRRVVVALLAAGFGYMLLFRNASYIHDYYLLYTTPAFALLAAAAMTNLPRRRARWLRPLVAALALVTLPATLYYLNEIHSSSDPALGLEFAQAVRAQTAPGDLILSNLPSIGYALEFYAERSIAWDTSPSDALEQAQRSSQQVYYLHCDSYAALPSSAPRLGEAAINSQCGLTRLR